MSADVDGNYLVPGPDCSGGCRTQHGKAGWPCTRQGMCVMLKLWTVQPLPAEWIRRGQRGCDAAYHGDL
eukprot:365333-Chlamydomonas_euryale.AAC.7